MPELWIPYGQVETLITVQAENLGTVVEPAPETSTAEIERLAEVVKEASSLFVCDSTPSTLELLKQIVPSMAPPDALKLFAAAPKKIESSIAEIRGRIATLPPPLSSAEGGLVLAQPLTQPGRKAFLGTARPDPLFGIVDAKVEACLNWVAHSMAEAASSKVMEPSPFHKTDSREKMEEIAGGITEASYLNVIPRGGRVKAVMEDAPFDAIKNGFMVSSLPQARALVVGAGGRGYDDTLSSSLRCVWNALAGVKRSGAVLLVAECSEGLGSTALEMLATGRMTVDTGRRKEKYVDGMEEVFYLNKLKEEYEVLLLSGLPEVYARSKLGLTTARGSGEAVGRILNKLGRTGKMNVVTRAAECWVSSA
ncbi:MAG: hypothetical protein OK438_04025 [Thaumarchaeota archaeon]|nr:hypothetical protein [Nitrososphaerota archaeon]